MKNISSKLIFIVTILFLVGPLSAARIKDITSIKGARSNQLMGYGLIVGLAGQGDGRIEYTEQAIINALQRYGIKITKADKAKNVAAVMVTAEIGPYAKEGTKIDAKVSSMGDAESLQGGTLLQTALMGADQIVYAVAQGPVAVGGFKLGGGGEGDATVQKNHPTVGIISNGAIVEREIPMNVVENGSIELLLQNPDYMSAVRVADLVNSIHPDSAMAEDPTSVNVKIPERFRGQEVNFIASLGHLDVIQDNKARIIINERTGTIVATSNVRISKVAVSHGSLSINIDPSISVSQPNSFTSGGATSNADPNRALKIVYDKLGSPIIDEAGNPLRWGNVILGRNDEAILDRSGQMVRDLTGTIVRGRDIRELDNELDNLAANDATKFGANTEVVKTSDVSVSEAQGGFKIVNDYPTLERLTSALNSLGVTTREMISILQTMKQAGAIQAELIIN